jgi:acetyl esterase/lipase
MSMVGDSLKTVVQRLGRPRNLGAFALNATIPRRGYRVERGIAYGPEGRHRLDLYVPQASGPTPVVLFLYGGGWTSGSRAIYRFLGEALTSAGIAVGVADYGLYPDVKYPEFLDDSARAFRFLREKANSFGGDPQRLFLAGHSAGAYNAVMLGVNRRYLNDEDRAALKGVIGIAGLYDFLPLTSASLIAVFGGDNIEETQPIRYVDGKAPPMLLAYGTKDNVVHPKNSRRMANKLREYGSEVELREFETAGHTDIIVSLARGFRGRTSLREDIVKFVQSH